MDIKPGDIVMLKSGGPSMTVMGKRAYEPVQSNMYAQALMGASVAAKYDRPITCAWFETGTGVFRQQTFEEDALEPRTADQ